MQKLFAAMLSVLISGVLSAGAARAEADEPVPSDTTKLPYDGLTSGRVAAGRDRWFTLVIPAGAPGGYVVVDLEGKTPGIDIDLALTDWNGRVLHRSVSGYRNERVFAQVPENRRVAVRVFIYRPEDAEVTLPAESEFALRAYTLPQPPLGPYAPTLPPAFTDVAMGQPVSGMVRGTPAWYRYHIEDTGILQIAFEGEGLEVALLVEDGSQVFEGTGPAEPLLVEGDANTYTDFFMKVTGSGRYRLEARLRAAEIPASEPPPVRAAPDTLPAITVLFGGRDAAQWGVTAAPTALTVSARGNPVMAVNGNLFDLAGRKFLAAAGEVGYCAYAPSGALFVVSGRSLGYYAGGEVRAQVRLPENGMKLAATANGLYLFGGDRRSSTGLYYIDPAKGYVKILDMPQPIGAASAFGDTLFVAVANDIYRLAPGGEIQLICRLPGPAVTSVAAAAAESLFFTAGRALYSWRRGEVRHVAEDIGDIVSWHADDLLVLDSRNRNLIRIDRLP